ncbi:lysoplasmalogenase family protein [Streptomyces sp. H10-C2]|uniref:lysoplasmalogenase n=1 Tax=unclassified Streptomyces TaxID=2593676 RepID=UPI0024B90154|nr:MULTISPECIES: lysoplasmalogenase family protein [unclassified Streptomyces]MDJ0344848.1 lysoplasmalogenase family protein [Streptomyces sp. PH10-H1]MDJ0371908.1 lysoplasmalogenase family protein [Streptomyces sp. H10-C2]
MSRARTARTLLAAFAVIGAVHLVAVLAGWDLARHLTKPALMPVLAGWAAARGGPRPLIAALLFGWGGDVALQIGGDLAFLAGMGSFAAGHVCYLVLFVRRGAFADRRATLRRAAGYAVVWLVVITLLWGGLDASLRIPVAGYSLLLTAMAAGAAGLGARAAAGGALFLLSDTLIAAGIADWPLLPAHDFWIMLTYLAAQYLLAAALTGDPSRAASRPQAYREVTPLS